MSVEESTTFAPRFDAQGLICAVAVDASNGRVLMVAWMNREALDTTLATGQAHYWSRSRGELWRKGATSGATQAVVEVRVDCDQDCILLRVEQNPGGACHTGRDTCFYRRVLPGGTLAFDGEQGQ
jgi:phosphoribosyl-AMP cyclohydrolase